MTASLATPKSAPPMDASGLISGLVLSGLHDRTLCSAAATYPLTTWRSHFSGVAGLPTVITACLAGKDASFYRKRQNSKRCELTSNCPYAMMALSRNTQERFFFFRPFRLYSYKPLHPSKRKPLAVFRDKKRSARMERFVMSKDAAWRDENETRLGRAEQVAAVHGTVRCGRVRCDRAGCAPALFGVAGMGRVRHGMDAIILQDLARRVRLWRGLVGRGVARHGKDAIILSGRVRRGQVRLYSAVFGLAGLGTAWNPSP